MVERALSLFPGAPMFLLLLACSEPPPPTDEAVVGDPTCNPLLGGSDCFLPYPSDFFRVPDESTATGWRIEVAGAARILDRDGFTANVGDWQVQDGFSRVPFILATLGAEATMDGLVGIFDDPSTQGATYVLREDGSTVPHFVDLDPYTERPDRQGIVLHPMERLDAETRYVVVLAGVRGADGQAIAAPDGTVPDRYDTDVWPVVEAVGIARGDVQLAWDFTTGSDENVEGDQLRARSLALDWLAANPPTVTIDEVVEPADGGPIWRVVHGRLTAPLYMDSAEPGATLFRDGQGLLAQNGTTDVPFTAVIPSSVRDGVEPARVMAFGHGFFYNRSEVEEGALPTILDDLGMVGVAIDWWGMSDDDVDGVVITMLDAPAETLSFGDRVHQAHVNWLATTAAVRGALSTEASMLRADGALTYDPDQIYFFGISQGHVLGGTQIALNPDIVRASLDVGGGGFTHLIFRARPFVSFLAILQAKLADPLDRQKFIATAQRGFDRFDPLTYADYVLAAPLDGDPTEVMMQVGLADTQVPNIGSWMHARALGLGQTEPMAKEVWGIPAQSGDSGVTVFDFGIDDAFYAQASALDDENEVHGAVRRLSAVTRQMDGFFHPNAVLVHPCDGVCDPE